jgi:type II secretory ATPase GspE/PulE/Tfp pilus assembly ATPase PilB-like protein
MMAAESGLLMALVREGVIDAAVAGGLGGREARGVVALLRERAEVDDERLTAAIARWLHLPYLSGREIEVDPRVHGLLAGCSPEVTGVLPLHRKDDILRILVADPFDMDLRDRLEAMFGEAVEIVLASPAAIGKAMAGCNLGQDRLERASRSLPQAEGGIDATAAGSVHVDENSAPIVKLFNTILREAVTRRASDVHIEAMPWGTSVKCRVDGVLQPMLEPLSPAYHDALVTRIKVMAELDITEHRQPQDGRFSMDVLEAMVDFRVSILPGIDKEAVVVRVLDCRSMPGGMGLDRLGLPDGVLRSFRRAITAPHGLVLVTGPTGSGKTTTLYAALNELDHDREKIITIEDPVEYKLPGVLQIAVNEKKKLAFATGLRAILRHDPDKIMVGEIRDAETAHVAIQSALTGHLVFTTVHANDTRDVLFRMRHMGIEHNSFVHALNCILAQRLIRKLCHHCRRPLADAATQGTVLPEKYAGTIWQEAVGCAHCHATGYAGRTVITEFLRLTPELKEQLAGQHAITAIGAADSGHRTLRESALALAAAGVTSLNEVFRVTGLD